MIPRLRDCAELRGLMIVIVVFAVPASLGAQEVLVAQAYDAEAARYRLGIEGANGDGPRIITLRNEHRARLRDMLKDAVERGLPSYEVHDLLALAKVATELAEWRRVVEIHQSVKVSAQVDPLLLRLVLHAHIQLGEIDAAERRLTEIRRLHPLNRDIDAAHIAFANAYEKAGSQGKALEHLGAFLRYVIDSLEQSPALADAFPSLLSRYKRAGKSGDDAFIKNLRERLAPLIRRVNAGLADPITRKTVTLTQLNAVYSVDAALTARTSPDDIAETCTRWAQGMLTALSSKSSLSPLEKQQALAFVSHIARFAGLLERQADVQQLIELQTAIEAATRRHLASGEEAAVRRAFEESRRSLELRVRHLGLVGTSLSKSSLENLGVAGSASSDSQAIVILIWSPIAPNATGVLDRMRALVQLNSGTRLVIIAPFRSDSAGSEERRTELANRLMQLASRNPAVANSGIEFIDVNSAAMKELQVASLPQIVVLDSSHVIRKVLAAGDEFGFWALERSLDSINQPAPQHVGTTKPRTDRVTSNVYRRRGIRRLFGSCSRPARR